MADFDYFTVFAEMRTGSNFLEANLNALDGVACHGEAFNPHFIGYPNRDEILGISREARDDDPQLLIGAIRGQADALGGFRYFHDHDPRVLDPMLDDPRCAKIVLTRNPLDSYVSWKIAQETGQWKLTDVKRRKAARARFDPDEFARHVGALQQFQQQLLNRLQIHGQTAFYLAYEDLQDLEVMNGLAQWLGIAARLDKLDQSLKPQNPAPVTEKVTNPDEMAAALAGLDRFNLTRTPNFEPRRGPVVPSYLAAAETPLLYMPVRGGPEAAVAAWLAALDGLEADALPGRMTQKDLRQWKRRHPGHRSFTVLRHPVARAHHVFCTRILDDGPGSFRQIRDTLRRKFKLPIPKSAPDEAYDVEAHRAAFEGFLDFVKMNLAGQTAIRVDSAWGTQAQALSGFADFAPPDLVLREDELEALLPDLARRVGHAAPPAPGPAEADGPVPLASIYDRALEARVAEVYQRDYMMFGFGPWRTA
ncbi:nodulation protein NodH [Antarcticimicrobium luteum]|uniref:Nodulation protein NodH n=1 Tax=Antarcticimicrobium luteum TaxID=2547397 RepID=A0A4R5VCI0_9RHOB|nr:nodulation protein NodH [Antarcticimicrobium luteum]TDK49993.1 nodulation protein NodH [Antarcticimicrobium luteum]